MKYIDLPKPHGYFIWKGKQKAVASNEPLAEFQTLVLLSGNEVYGKIKLDYPNEVDLEKFAELEDLHRVRPQDRKLYWPEAEKFYIHPIRSFWPYYDIKDDSRGLPKRVVSSIAYTINGDEISLIEPLEIDDTQKEILGIAEQLPKTILLEGTVSLNGNKAIITDGIDPAKVQQILAATLENADLGDATLDLYQLALVRVPNLLVKKKELTMPYKVVADYDECKDEGKPVGIVNTETDELEGCSKDEETAKEAVSAMMANEKKSLSEDIQDGLRVKAQEKLSKLSTIKEQLAEARKCYDDGMAMPVMYGGPVTFADLEALEEMKKVAYEMDDLSYRFQMLSNNVLSNPEISDKGKALSALAGEYSNLVQQVGKKELSDSMPKLELKVPLSEKENEEYKAGKRVNSSMKEKLKAAWETLKEFMDWANEADKVETTADVMSKGFGIKQVNGIPWFIAYSTNAFMDREGEIFSTKSLEQYVSDAELKGDRGFFNFWHIPNTDFAKKEWQSVVGRVLIEAGPFLDNELGQAAYKFFEQYPEGHPDIAPDGWGTSPEYRYLPEERKTGVYENIWISRTSALSRMAAANIWTKGNIKMALTDKQVESGKTFFGEELFAKIVTGAEEQTKELEKTEAHKSVDVVETTETKTEIEVPIDAIAEAVIKKLDLNFQPFSDALALVGEEIASLKAEMKSYEKQKQLEDKVETPRFVFSLQQASKSKETIVPEGDELKDKKPQEAKVSTDGSLASLYFPQR